MAHQFPPQHQSHQPQMSHQPQNIGQQRQATTVQQPMPQTGQSRLISSQQTSHSSFDPGFALFTFERAKGSEGWEDVEAEQQYIKAEELESDVKKFQRNKKLVKNVLNEIPTSNCRRLINQLVKEENHKLLSRNRNLQWNIASVDVEWKPISQRRRQLKRVSVILQTTPSSYEDPTTFKVPAGMPAKPPSMMPNQGLPQQPHHSGQEIPQLPRNPLTLAQQPMGHQQLAPPPPPPPMQMPRPQGNLGAQAPGPAHGGPLGQSHPGQHLPPPPPPPAPNAMNPHPPLHKAPSFPGGPPPPPPPPPPGPSAMNPPPPPHRVPPFPGGPPPPPHPPPPPPPGPVPGGPGPLHNMPRPPMPGQQQARMMPGTFQEPPQRPAARPGQPQGRHMESSPEYDSDGEDDWISESSDSSSDRFRIRHVERGEFAHIGKPPRGRSRRSSRSKNPRHSHSPSKGRSQSRSHTHTRAHRSRRDPEYLNHPPMGKYSPTSSKDNSPRNSKQQLPANIHIHMPNTTTENTARSNDRLRRDSHGASSPDFRKGGFSAEPMMRGNSWDRHSGTASFDDNSSVHTADDSIFSEPDRRGRRSRHQSDIVDHSPKLRSHNLPHDRRDGFGHPHASHIYGEVESRPHRSAYPLHNDSPRNVRQRDGYFDDQAYPRPGVPRRNSAQVPQGHPFDTARDMPRLARASTLAPEMYESVYGQHREAQYPSDRYRQDNYKFDNLFNALDELREERRPLQGRRVSDYDRVGNYGGFEAYNRRGY